MDKKKRNQFFMILATILLFGCGQFTSSPAVLPPEQLGTAIVQTAAALATQTALFAPPTSQFPTAQPTITDTPTETPTETETPTAFIVIVPSRTPTITPTRTGTPTQTPTKTLNQPCMIAAQVPANNTQFGAGAFFDTVWTVVNTGTVSWPKGNVDFIYTSGTKFHLMTDILDIPATTGPGQSVAFVVHMQAPATSGTYIDTWSLVEGNTTHCVVSVTIVVK
jgi:hypothetical protein